MQFVKTHWISLACGAVVIVAIVVGVIGMTRKEVIERVNARLAMVRDIEGLRGSAKNEDTIHAEKERGRKFDEEYTRTLEMAASINKREPLLEGVFPRPASIETAYRFLEVYRAKLSELPRQLRAGGPPTAQEIQDEIHRMLEEEAKRKEAEGGEGGGVPPAPEPPAGPSVAPAPGLRPPTPTVVSSGATGTTSGADQAEAARRAAIRKAHNIRMYAEASSTRWSFHVSPIVQAERAPSPRDMWYAQVSLWLQQDVVDAIRSLNEEAAAQLEEKDAHVGNMPVKRIVSLQVLGYLTAGGQLAPFEVLAPATGPLVAHPGASELRPSFTGRRSDEQFDVVRLVLVAVVDQRYLLSLIDRITRVNFYQLVGASYTAVPPGGQDGEYLYGGAPCVIATLDFEGYMARKVYQQMMPEEVLQVLSAAAQLPQP